MTIRDTKHRLGILISLAAVITVLLPTLADAGSMGKARQLIDRDCVRVSDRSLLHFLKEQGTSNNPPQFFPPVKDYVGWTDGALTTFALVDYAGLANEAIKLRRGPSLGTEVRGIVRQCELRGSDKARITVALFTTRALGFAQSVEALAENNFDFLNTPTIFGAKAVDVIKASDAAVGPATLLATFTISTPNAPLPDFLDVVNNAAAYAPVKFSFKSITFGVCADRQPARLEVHQVAATDETNNLVYSEETVEAVDYHGRNCSNLRQQE